MRIAFYNNYKDVLFDGNFVEPASFFDVAQSSNLHDSKDNKNIKNTGLWNLLLSLNELELPGCMVHIYLEIDNIKKTFTFSDTFRMKLAFTNVTEKMPVALCDLSFSKKFLYKGDSTEITEKTVSEWKSLIKSFLKKQKNEKIKTKVFLETQVKELDSVIKMYPGNL